MGKTNIIIFSKNRTLQLKSLLMSIINNSDISEEEINIIYTTNADIFYEPLIKTFDCNFLLQSNFFNDLRNIIFNSKADYVFFMVDDLIFRDEFSLRKIEDLLDSNKDIQCFALRLGKHIKDRKQPDFFSLKDDIIVWDTSRKTGSIWKYFWEVSGSIYRRDMVIKYLTKCNGEKVNYPNPLESHYYRCMPSYLGSWKRKLLNTIQFGSNRSNRIACFEMSKCFTQGVNLVAHSNNDYKTTYDTLELHKKMEDGFTIDYKSLKNVENTWPNTGNRFFKLTKEKGDTGIYSKA